MHTPENLPESIGPYRLIRPIGEGGMAHVYLAEKTGYGGFSREVALKVIRPHLVMENPRFVQEFIDEARLGGLLTHPHIVATLDCGMSQEIPFIAMEYVPGPTLHAVIGATWRSGAPLAPQESLEILRQAAEGVGAAHRATYQDGRPLNMVHRDLKPSNLLFTLNGLVKVADFGVARAESNVAKTQNASIVKGTVRFMSPEQAYGDALDGRSDLYSLGILLYEMLTGRPLYPGDSTSKVLRMAQDAAYAPLDLELPALPARAGILALLTKALSRDPEARFQDAQHLIRAIEALQEHLPRPRLGALVERCLRVDEAGIAAGAGLSSDGIPSTRFTLSPPPNPPPGSAPPSGRPEATGPAATPTLAPPTATSPLSRTALVALVLLLGTLTFGSILLGMGAASRKGPAFLFLQDLMGAATPTPGVTAHPSPIPSPTPARATPTVWPTPKILQVITPTPGRRTPTPRPVRTPTAPPLGRLKLNLPGGTLLLDGAPVTTGRRGPGLEVSAGRHVLEYTPGTPGSTPLSARFTVRGGETLVCFTHPPRRRPEELRCE